MGCCSLRAFLLGALAIASPAQTFTTLSSFNFSDGDHPDFESLVQGTDGNLYGTSLQGGANNAGTVFKLTTSGTLTTIHSFDGADGGYPGAGLVLASDGNPYGTTEKGGASGYGTIFRITPDATLTTLHSFAGTDGEPHNALLIQAADGNLYGTTEYGGASGPCQYGCGTIL